MHLKLENVDKCRQNIRDEKFATKYLNTKYSMEKISDRRKNPSDQMSDRQKKGNKRQYLTGKKQNISRHMPIPAKIGLVVKK